MNIQQHIKNWKRAVAGWDFAAWPEVIEASSEQEFYLWCRLLNDATAKANAAGHNARGRGTGKKGEKQTMWITAKEYSLKIAYTPRPRQRAVTDTSRAAYMTVDFTTVRGRIAQAIMDATVAGRDITRNEIVETTGISVNSVCGRVNELLKGTAETPIQADGKTWRLMVTGRRKSNITGGGEVENEALRFVEVGAARVSEQARLF